MKDVLICANTTGRKREELPPPPLTWPEIVPKTTCNVEARPELEEQEELERAPDVWDLSKRVVLDRNGVLHTIE